ncbi:MAG: accessory Sec system translocase SecA2 [Candidatus Aminicenantes bacterium]|jgi:preprotein translocase subunit SecA
MKTKNGKVLSNFYHKLVGSPIEYDLSPYRKILFKIKEVDLTDATDGALKQKSSELIRKARNGASVNELLIESYALVRETAWRKIGLRPFDVQVMAGIVMVQEKVAELPTGEGKTLAAVFPIYLNALSGRGVHVHTFNDYLARRDAAWMRPIYRFLGLTVGCIQEGMSAPNRKRAYAADITYTTAKEAGFDYLRDHLCYNPKDLVHREFHFALVDEADSILIDEARVPLVIAGNVGQPKIDPGYLAEVAKALKRGVDFETDEEKRNIYLTDVGINRIEDVLKCGNLHAPENLEVLTKVNLALHAEYLIQRDVDYIVRKGKVEIVDEFTGRVVEDRHWPDGLQAAVEAKEKLNLGSGGSILGQITLQHFLNLYPKLSGMTATAQSAADELKAFYDLRVVKIPPHKPCIREDLADVVFTHKEAKTRALIEEIRQNHSTKRPILVGTASVEESEALSLALRKAGIGCRVLNAKNDELEAKIVARAGEPGAVTISTNMAGRGTDIKLGGDAEQEKDRVVGLGGLYVIGTNRHESLRIDVQLRGRAGRQGDPGSSRFFISLEDDLMKRYSLKRFFPPKMRSQKQEGPLGFPFVSREVARGQRIVEGQNFEIRKTLWNYSSLIDKQREIVFRKRQQVLWDGLSFGLLSEKAPDRYKKLESLIGKDRLRKIQKQITLFQIDRCWAEHLAKITDVRESIHLVNVGGKSPINEFHKILTEAFLKLDQKIDNAVFHTFNSLKITGSGADLDSKELRGPSSTWTYLISDNQFGAWVEMLKGKNIGFAVGAAAFWGPLYILWGLVQRYYKKKE